MIVLREVRDEDMPIHFEQQCRSCHPLHYGASASMRTAEAPHGQPGELLRQLRRAYLEDALSRPGEGDRRNHE